MDTDYKTIEFLKTHENIGTEIICGSVAYKQLKNIADENNINVILTEHISGSNDDVIEFDFSNCKEPIID